MSTEYTVKRANGTNEVIGTKYFGGKDRGTVFSWRVAPHTIINSLSAIVYDEAGYGMTPAQFFVDVVPWPMVEWEKSEFYKE
jgi:hypothetical protein